MFARSFVKTAGRQAFRPATFTVPTTRARFSSTTRKLDRDVEVVSYEKGQRMEETLSVSAASSNGPVSPAGADAEKVAYPLHSSVFQHLTPTLSNFTLKDKVAIVTGLVGR